MSQKHCQATSPVNEGYGVQMDPFAHHLHADGEQRRGFDSTLNS